MEKLKPFIKKILKILKDPPKLLILLNWLITFIGAASSLTLCILSPDKVLSYVTYSITALSLSYTVYSSVRSFPSLRQNFNSKIKSNRYTGAFLENYSIRTLVSAVLSLVINLGFAVFNTVISIINRSVFYGSSAVYYILLSFLKGGIFYKESRNKREAGDNKKRLFCGRLKSYRFCGIALFVIQSAMASVIAVTVSRETGSRFTEAAAITFAAYSFYKITFAVINALKARAYENILLQCFRNIALAEAALSLVSLQIALVSTFSSSPEKMSLLNTAVAAMACLFIIALGIFMIVKANKRLSVLNKSKVTREKL